MSFPHPLKDPPERVKRFWRSRFGQGVVEVLEPSKWWVLIFVIGLVAINVWTLTIYRSQSRDEARHAAAITANAQGQYVACVKSIPVLRKINAFISGSRIVDDALVTNSLANLHVTMRGTHLYAVRLSNLARLERARTEAAQVKFPVPTIASCAALRRRLLSNH